MIRRKSSGNHKCLQTIPWQSIQQFLRYFSLDQSDHQNPPECWINCHNYVLIAVNSVWCWNQHLVFHGWVFQQTHPESFENQLSRGAFSLYEYMSNRCCDHFVVYIILSMYYNSNECNHAQAVSLSFTCNWVMSF